MPNFFITVVFFDLENAEGVILSNAPLSDRQAIEIAEADTGWDPPRVTSRGSGEADSIPGGTTVYTLSL